MKTSVAKELYKRLAELGDFCPSGEIETWHVLDATGSTITRKLRLLCESRYLEVKYVDGHAHYKALVTQAERDAYTPPVSPQEPLGEDLEEELEGSIKVRFEPVFEPGNPRPVSVREIHEIA